jgi:hypothetical protein
MKHMFSVLAFVLCISAQAQRSGFGAGLIIGEPTGFSVKGWLTGDRAIDGALAWDLGHGGSFRLHGDYLFHKYDLIKVGKGALPLYYGPGLRMRFWNDGRHWRHGEWHDESGRMDLAVRFPVGLAYQFDGAPVDCFFELVPALGLIPSTYLDFDLGIGARYWFK